MAVTTDFDLAVDLDLDHDRAVLPPQQLTLLASSDVPVQFRLDRRTREVGLAHIARIRRQLADRAAARGHESGAVRRPDAA